MKYKSFNDIVESEEFVSSLTEQIGKAIIRRVTNLNDIAGEKWNPDWWIMLVDEGVDESIPREIKKLAEKIQIQILIYMNG